MKLTNIQNMLNLDTENLKEGYKYVPWSSNIDAQRIWDKVDYTRAISVTTEYKTRETSETTPYWLDYPKITYILYSSSELAKAFYLESCPPLTPYSSNPL